MSDRKKLIKLQIRSFAERTFTASSEDESRKFTTPINPETFSQAFKVNVDSQNGHGNQATEVRYKSTAPEELRLEFILDGTRTLENYGGDKQKEFEKKSVHQQLVDLKRCVYDMDGTIHRPRFLIVQWGTDLSFRCVLSNLELNYTLFEPDGSPLRIKVNATFLAHKSREEIQAEARTSSPDLTHYRKVKQGDRLDQLTNKIYNDSKYFMQVGKVNKLVTIRKINPGTDLYFPPIDKTEA
jgi:Contractile injection system tube protein